MKITVKMIQGSECTITITESTSVSQLKEMVEDLLMVEQSNQRLVFHGKTLTDDSTLQSAGVTDGAKIHLMVKKADDPKNTVPLAQKPVVSPSQKDLFVEVETLLGKHLSPEQTTTVVSEFKKNCELMIKSMNFEDIERFAASNFTEF